MITFPQGWVGGLGNQMFQYAAVRALSCRLNTDFHYPVQLKNNPDGRPQKYTNIYDVFNLSPRESIEEHNGGGLVPAPLPGDWAEKRFDYNEDFLKITNPDTRLIGYFQSEKYFKEYEDVIRKDFTFKQTWATSLMENTTSIHVRRGDYVDLPEHPVCSLEYYNKAMAHFKDHKFFVFSDDIAWCMDNFKGDRFVFMQGDQAKDLDYMCSCENHIIANSSFGWWGAWLGKNKNKKVIAPSEWFTGAMRGYPTHDIYCEDWVVI